MFQGHIDLATQAYVVGWAAEDGVPCAVMVAYGDMHETIHPNMHRPDLAAAGLPAGAGFAFTLAEPLTADDQLHLLFADGSEMPGSPCRLHQPRLRELLDETGPDQLGIEFGPLDRPILSKRRARVDYVDHASRDELVAKYAHSGSTETFNPSRLVPVDVVWPGGPLAPHVPGGRRYDYAVASHVIEHVPDMIGWLNEISSVLRPHGLLNLAIPDKHKTFDWPRRTTSLSAFVAAHVERRIRPSAVQIFDHIAFTTPFGTSQPHDLPGAFQSTLAAEADGRYMDVHCQVFTSHSFLAVMSDIAKLGLIDFRLRRFFPTRSGANEFIVSLEKSDMPVQDIARSYALAATAI